MLNRITNAYKALKGAKVFEELGVHTQEELTRTGQLGDGNAEVLPDMTEEEYEDYIEQELQGWNKFKSRFGL